MNGIVYDEISQFFNDSQDHLRQAVLITGKQFGKSIERMRASFHDSALAVDFTSVMSPAQREAHMRRETFYKYRAACHHGERSFFIKYAKDVKEKVGKQ